MATPITTPIHAKLITLGRKLGYAKTEADIDSLCNKFTSSRIWACQMGDKGAFFARATSINTKDNLASQIYSAQEKRKNKELLTPDENNDLNLQIPAFYEKLILHQSPEEHTKIFDKLCEQGIKKITLGERANV